MAGDSEEEGDSAITIMAEGSATATTITLVTVTTTTMAGGAGGAGEDLTREYYTRLYKFCKA